ncbi:serine/threonine transporter SstT domain protein [Neisseria gonorrhoeae]|nr:serine/threonine transporter SstT domain protein [Neisseria gonorrhoeae]
MRSAASAWSGRLPPVGVGHRNRFGFTATGLGGRLVRQPVCRRAQSGRAGFGIYFGGGHNRAAPKRQQGAYQADYRPLPHRHVFRSPDRRHRRYGFSRRTLFWRARGDVSAAPPSGIVEVLKSLLMNLVANPINAIANANYIAFWLGLWFWARRCGITVRTLRGRSLPIWRKRFPPS